MVLDKNDIKIKEKDDQQIGVSATVSFGDVIDALGEEESDLVLKAMAIIQDTVENPASFVGNEAAKSALVLAGLRTKCGMYAQYYKTHKGPQTNERKNLLQTMYQALEENINTLKLIGRMESRESRG